MVTVPPLLLSALEVITLQRGDDDSFSSTIWSIDNEHAGKPVGSSSWAFQEKCRSERRSVRFNEETNIEYVDERKSIDDMDVEDSSFPLTPTWYSSAEYLHLRQSAVSSAQQIMAIESRNRAPRSYIKVIESCFERCINFEIEEYERNDRVHLIRWVQVATSRIGLEKWTVKQISVDRSRRRAGVLQAVLSSTDSETRRIASLKWSTPAVLFARVWADAIAAAVIHEDKAGFELDALASQKAE